jgi:hypothetical protein
MTVISLCLKPAVERRATSDWDRHTADPDKESLYRDQMDRPKSLGDQMPVRATKSLRCLLTV